MTIAAPVIPRGVSGQSGRISPPGLPRLSVTEFVSLGLIVAVMVGGVLWLVVEVFG